LVQTKKLAAHKQLIATCDACMLAKSKSKSHGEAIDHGVKMPNDKAVGDVIGPITVANKVEPIAGASPLDPTQDPPPTTYTKFYISVITDVFSRHVSAFILSEKRPSEHVLSYATTSRLTTNQELLHFHTDGGKEYNQAEHRLKEKGVKVTRTPPHTPQWNGIAERKNRTILEMARAMLIHSGLDPDVFWKFAVETAVYTHNRVNVINKHNKTPHELFTNKKPDLGRIRTFGCDAIVKLNEPNQGGKMGAKAEKGIFIGYDMRHEGSWRIWVMVDGKAQIRYSCHVDFIEEFTMAREHSRTGSGPGANTPSNGHGTNMDTPRSENEKLQDRIDRCLPFGSIRGSDPGDDEKDQ